MDGQLFHSEDFPILVESGFIAVKLGYGNWAQNLFHGASWLKPNNSAPALGCGYAALHAMDLPAAEKIFSDVLKHEPKNAMAKVLLGFTFLIQKFVSINRAVAAKQDKATVDANVERGTKLIQEAMRESKEASVQNLGKASLALLDKVVAYQRTPL